MYRGVIHMRRLDLHAMLYLSCIDIQPDDQNINEQRLLAGGLGGDGRNSIAELHPRRRQLPPAFTSTLQPSQQSTMKTHLE